MRSDAFNPNISDFVEKSVKHNGNVSALAQEYNVSRITIYEYFKRNPQAKEMQEKIQSLTNEILLDHADKVLLFNLENYVKKPGLAQRAAEKVIDKKGHLRGWGIVSDENSPREQEIVDRHELIQSKYRIEQLEKELNEIKSKANPEFQRSQ